MDNEWEIRTYWYDNQYDRQRSLRKRIIILGSENKDAVSETAEALLAEAVNAGEVPPRASWEAIQR